MCETRNSSLLGKITVLFVICFFVLSAQAKYGGGTGEPNDPYLIVDANQMNAIGADSNDWDKHFKLMADIDLAGYTGTSFNIIGYYVRYGFPDNNPFAGVFDGNGHTISNFTYASLDKSYIGLFGYVRGEDAEIKNLGLIDPDVDAGTGGNVGSLVGWLRDGTITNCYVEAGTVAGNGSVGGLVGRNYGAIFNCYSACGIVANRYVGGLVGMNFGIINNSYATASVSGVSEVGGLVGLNWEGTITNCYSTGGVAGGPYGVGGLVGYNNGSVTTSFWDIETSGQTTSSGGTGKMTAEMQIMSTFTDAGWDFESVWWILEGAGYPRLCWEEKYGGGTGHPNDPYLIYTAEQMNTIGACQCDWDRHFKLMADIDLAGFTGTSFNIIGELYYDSGWIVNPFTGVFDGNGHILSNFTYASTDTNRVGLFGYVDDTNAEIKDLGLINPNVNAGTGNGVGSLVGLLSSGKITNCYVEGGSVSGDWRPGGLVGDNEFGTITDCYSTTSVLGDWYVGGLVGDNGGTITNCYSPGSVSGDWLVGGLVGRNYGTVINCYATASVSGTDLGTGGLVGENGGTITNCYSAGSVTGTTAVGGLVGHNHNGTISNCYSTGSVSGTHGVGGGLVGSGAEWRVADSFWDTQTSGQATSDGGTGLTTAEMQTESTFTEAGWDFVGETLNGIEDIWFIPKGDYPHLWWEGIQVPMKLTPRTLNCRSKGNWVKAHLTLPEGFTVADVDSNRPAVLHSFGFESAPLYVFVNENKRVQIEAAFEREAVCSLTGDWPETLTVAGFLTDGNIFLGTSTVRMITPGLKDIAELALYWLNTDCVHPDFCNGIDMNRDSLVNLLDYALFLNSQVEFVSE